MISIEALSRGHDLVGEGPLWCASEQALFWIDIACKRIYRQRIEEAHSASWPLLDYPGCLAEISPGRLAVAMGEGVHQIDLNSGAVELRRFAPGRRAATRFNDGKVDPQGRFWVGTMQNNFSACGEISVDRFDGALYRFDSSQRVDALEQEVGIPNTLAWSPDRKRFFFGDSLKGCICVYDFDEDSGDIRNKRMFHDCRGYGVPDGSAIDVDGCLWNARWDGGALLRIRPDGQIDRVLSLPIPRPTSCAFGGPDLKTLFVTSATNGLTSGQLAEFPLSGSVLAIHGVATGIPVPPMKLTGE